VDDDLMALPLFIPPLNFATNTCCFFFYAPLGPLSSLVPLALPTPALPTPLDPKIEKETLDLFFGKGNAYGSSPARTNELLTIYILLSLRGKGVQNEKL